MRGSDSLTYHAARQKDSVHLQATPPTPTLVGLINIACEYYLQNGSVAAQALTPFRICQRRCDLLSVWLYVVSRPCCGCMRPVAAAMLCSTLAQPQGSLVTGDGATLPRQSAQRTRQKWRQRVEPALTWDCALTAVTPAQGQGMGCLKGMMLKSWRPQ